MKKLIPGLSFKIILDIVYGLFLPAILMLYVLKRKYHSGWLERICLMRWRRILKEKRPLIWIHAVSLGEARLAVLLYEKLRPEFSQFKYLLTVVTPVGEEFLKAHVALSDYVAYLPLDFSFLIRHIFSKISVKMVLIIETEIWPHLIIEAKRCNALVGLVNARISKQSYPKYKILKPLTRRILNIFDFVCSSGEVASGRLKSLGLEDERIVSQGTLKFDLMTLKVREDRRIEQLECFLKENNHPLFIAGSTHRGEDIMIFKAYQNIVKSYPDLKFLIAPRHLKGLERFTNYVKQSGFGIDLFSSGFKFSSSQSIFLIDETGFLASLYKMADFVFIGGSLLPFGGHNIIEPALFRKAILIGPYFYNFEEIVLEFLKDNAILVSEKNNIEDSLRMIIKDSRLKASLGERAYQVALKNKGVLDKTADAIFSRLR
ncbi:MAG: glycosyltransferase N-terminal domain-containing protein [Candidatus Saelkia tenebricola]|nr:glycosyltransferase N-terminal domain-containing protein [Candidatus Saelkia tenebricola]